MSETLHNIAAWRVFERIVKTGSLSRAAIELDLSASRASRLLSHLEKELDAQLINRAVRPMQPTVLGERLSEKLQRVLPLWAEFEDALAAETKLFSVVRLSTPVGIGRFYLNAQLAEYHKIEPHVVIEASIEQGEQALLNHEIDVAFLPYTPQTSGQLTIYPAMHAFTMPLASPEYLKVRGTPHKPEDLRSHTLILKSGENFPKAMQLVLRQQKQAVRWKHVVFHHDMLNIKDAVLRGFGIAIDVPLGMVLDELKSGDLVPVLGGWHREYWSYCIATRSEDGADTAAGRFAAWYARRATDEIDRRREEGFRILGIDPNAL